MLLRTYYYYCPPYTSNPPTEDEKSRKASFDKFVASLQRLERFEVRLGMLVVRSCDACGKISFVQKKVDIQIAVDLVAISTRGQIQKAFLLSGDSDLVPAVRVAKDSGVEVVLIHGGPSNPPHRELFDVADIRLPMDKNLISKVRRLHAP